MYTFPNGAVQGGALCNPGELEKKLNELIKPPMTHEEREQALYEAFGWPGETKP
jgi:hypothetical protein